jgi:hypothetical protein
MDDAKLVLIQSRVDEMHSDIKEVKGILTELVKQGAVHNHVLTEHERRSTNLETRIIPIEKAYHRGLGMVALLVFAASLLSVLPKLFH